MKPRLSAIQEAVNALWNAPSPPVAEKFGTGVRLTSAEGRTADFTIKRSDLALSDVDFAAQVLTPALDRLRKPDGQSAE